MRGPEELYQLLEQLAIKYEYFEHPPVATVAGAEEYWKEIDSDKCKNIFFRNHKGDRHYLVIIEYRRHLDIRDLEQRLRQGKLTFASDRRLMQYLGVEPGSVSPFGLINDTARHVHVFIDKKLKESEKLAFHPNVNTATLAIKREDLIKFINSLGNSLEFISMYD